MPYNTTPITPSQEITGTVSLPLARVKKIIHADEDIGACSNNAAFAIAVATEMFIQYLAERCQDVVKSERRPRRNIQYRDVANAVARVDNLEFLSDVVPKTTTFRALKDKKTREALGSDVNLGDDVRSRERGRQEEQRPARNGSNFFAPKREAPESREHELIHPPHTNGNAYIEIDDDEVATEVAERPTAAPPMVVIPPNPVALQQPPVPQQPLPPQQPVARQQPPTPQQPVSDSRPPAPPAVRPHIEPEPVHAQPPNRTAAVQARHTYDVIHDTTINREMTMED